MMAYHFAEGTFFQNPTQTIVGVEQGLSLDLGGWTLRGRIDLVEQPHFGRLDVTDWKSSFAMPTADEWEGDYQTKLYALLLAFGVTEYGACLGADVEEFGLYLRFPRYLRDEGLAYKYTSISRVELVDLRLDLEDQLGRLEASLESQEWAATPGSHCAECVSPVECPCPGTSGPTRRWRWRRSTRR